MGFEFCEGVAEYQKKVHPRVVWSSGDREKVLELTNEGDWGRLRETFMAFARLDAKGVDGATGVLIAEKVIHAGAPVRLERLAVAAWLAPGEGALFDAVVKTVRWMVASYARPGSRFYLDAGGQGLALAYDLLYDRLEDADRRMLGRWLADQGVRRATAALAPGYLRMAGGNIALVAMVQALINLMAVWGDEEAGDLSQEREMLVRFLDASLQATTGPNGYPAEDMGYGVKCAARLYLGASLAGRAGWYDLEKRCPQFLKFGRAILHFVQPWGENLTNIGDHGDDFGLREFVLARLAKVTRDPVVNWLSGTLSYGAEPAFPEVKFADGRNVPASWLSLAAMEKTWKAAAPMDGVDATAYCDMSRGLASFRSGWVRDATYLYLDGGQRPTLAQGHEHDSSGHFGLSAVGEYFGISPGRYNMEQSGHSVVLVEGKSGQSTEGEWRATYYRGRLTGFYPDGFVDSASSDNSQQSNCFWSYRTVGLVKKLGRGIDDEMPAYAWTLDDVNADHGKVMPREYWWTMHTSPGNEIEVGERCATVVGRREGGMLDLFWATPDSTTLPAPYAVSVVADEATMSSFKYVTGEMLSEQRRKQKDAPWKQVHYAGYFRPRLVAKVSGPNGKFLTLMVPRAKGGEVPVFKRLANLDGGIAVSLRVGDLEDRIVCAYGHRLLIAEGIDLRGDWVVERRRVSTGEVLGRKLFGGDR
jgi:hypothetical protein